MYLEPIPSFSGETPAGLRGQQPAGEEGLLQPAESQGLRAGWGQHPSSQSLAVGLGEVILPLSFMCSGMGRMVSRWVVAVGLKEVN